jgi:TonB-linked SusC/RagA family outer membrane protein
MKKREKLLPFLTHPAYQKIAKIMKLTCAFMLLACIHVSAGTYSQDRVSLKLNGTEIKQALNTIERKTSYRFLYNEMLLLNKPRVSINVINAEVMDVLNQILNGSGIGFRLLNNKLVVLKPLNGNNQIQLQEVRVTGKVLGAGGQPLPGVSVSVKGMTLGTTTDATGNFSITVPDENSVLVFSYVGYETQETVVGARTTIDISLVSAASTQMEQVVVIGYGTQKKRDLTGSVSSVKGEELARMPSTNPVSSLQGKVAGLTVVNSGRAGSSPTVRIRGVNSTSNTNPLYVVDGVFQTNIDYLNPADIESIEVLRDPSSIAIFGLQGGNGVIIVTTKRAVKGQTRVSFQSLVGVQKVIDKIDVTDAAGFKSLYDQQLKNLNAAPFDYSKYTDESDWQDVIFRDALINNNTISISNSNEKTTTLFSLGYNVQEGVLKYDKYQKYIARLNQELKISDRVKIGGDLTGFHFIEQDPGADLNNALWAAPIIGGKAGEGLYYSTPSFQRAQVSNPLSRLDLATGNSKEKGYRVIGSIFGEIKLMKELTFRSSFYADLRFNNSRVYSPLPFHFINLGNATTPTDTTFNSTVKTSVSQTQEEFRKFQQDHILTYTKTFNSVHQLTALAGFTTLFQGNSNVTGNRRDTSLNIPDNPAFWYLNIANANNPTTNGGEGGEESYMSFLGRVNYSFRNKYLVNMSLRRDGSSKFSPDNRWGTFGSVGLGWVISSEDFFNDVQTINFLKLRGAWGTVGSGLGLPTNLYLPGLNTAGVSVFGDNIYGSVTPAYVPDPNLHWEVVRGIDIGIDARAFKSRLNTEITFYDRTTKDILTTLTLPGTAGNYSYRTNLGTITNKGIEVNLGWNDRMGNELTYGLSANFSYNKNEVESIGDNINFEILGNGGVNKTVTKESIGYFYGYRQIGIYQTVADLDKTPGLSNSLPGDVAYADINADGIIDSKDRTYLGTPFPVYNFGANLSLGYKGFDFILEGQGVAGNKVYTQRRTQTFAVLNYEANRLNAWTSAGSTNVEPILDNTRGNNFLFSSYYLEPGDYFRIRTLQLGYNFPQRTLGKTGIKQFRVYISGQNIATFSETTGYTPEASLSDPIASGADNGTYPVPAVYSFGVNLTF